MQEKIVFENSCVPVHETSTGEKFVYGSELYKGLCITSSYPEWLYSKLKECNAVKGEDFFDFVKRSDSVDGYPKHEHMIKLHVAKSIIAKENDTKGGAE